MQQCKAQFALFLRFHPRKKRDKGDVSKARVLLAKPMAIFSALENFFSQEGPLADLLSNYRMRDDQLEMSKDVATCLNEGGRLLVEGGTGTGKSLAYLSAALLSDQQLTVSTATKALQDQLIDSKPSRRLAVKLKPPS